MVASQKVYTPALVAESVACIFLMQRGIGASKTLPNMSAGIAENIGLRNLSSKLNYQSIRFDNDTQTAI